MAKFDNSRAASMPPSYRAAAGDKKSTRNRCSRRNWNRLLEERQENHRNLAFQIRSVTDAIPARRSLLPLRNSGRCHRTIP